MLSNRAQLLCLKFVSLLIYKQFKINILNFILQHTGTLMLFYHSKLLIEYHCSNNHSRYSFFPRTSTSHLQFIHGRYLYKLYRGLSLLISQVLLLFVWLFLRLIKSAFRWRCIHFVCAHALGLECAFVIYTCLRKRICVFS